MKSRRDIPARVRILNETRQTLLADHADVAATARARRTGLLRRASLKPGEGLWIVPCEAVHSFGMKFAIDLVYIDRKKRVRKIRSAMIPRRLSACLTAHSVLELPSGTIASSTTRTGDRLQFEFIDLPN